VVMWAITHTGRGRGTIVSESSQRIVNMTMSEPKVPLLHHSDTFNSAWSP
jgi:hypothetical protein